MKSSSRENDSRGEGKGSDSRKTGKDRNTSAFSVGRGADAPPPSRPLKINVSGLARYRLFKGSKPSRYFDSTLNVSSSKRLPPP